LTGGSSLRERGTQLKQGPHRILKGSAENYWPGRSRERIKETEGGWFGTRIAEIEHYRSASGKGGPKARKASRERRWGILSRPKGERIMPKRTGLRLDCQPPRSRSRKRKYAVGTYSTESATKLFDRTELYGFFAVDVPEKLSWVDKLYLQRQTSMPSGEVIRIGRLVDASAEQGDRDLPRLVAQDFASCSKMLEGNRCGKGRRTGVVREWAS